MTDFRRRLGSASAALVSGRGRASVGGRGKGRGTACSDGPSCGVRASGRKRRRERGGRSWWATAIFAGLVALGATAATIEAQDVGLPVGSTPGAAEVEDLDGNTVDLATLVGIGKPALVEFWATWCPLCEELEPRLQDAKRRFGDRVDYFIVGVAVNQTPRRIQRHIEEHTPVGPVYYDRRGAAVRAYRAPTTSYVVILDAAGKVVYTGTGSDQPIVATLEKLLGG